MSDVAPQPDGPEQPSDDPPAPSDPLTARPGPPVQRDTGHTSASLQVAAAVMTQAFQAFGQLDFRQADPLMRRLLPRKDNGSVYEFYPAMRAAGLWALGRFSSGEIDAALEQECIARLNDMAPFDSEAAIVRAMAAVTLVRMGSNSKAALDTLRRWSEPDRRLGDVDILSCRWALLQLADEPFVKFDTPTINSAGWPIEPFVPTVER